MTAEKKQEFTRRITTANRTQLITVVYEIALEYLDEAKKAYETSDFDAGDTALRRARKCLDDLISALDMQYELSASLRELYFICKKKLVSAQGKHDVSQVSEVSGIIEKLLEAWKQIEPYDTSKPDFEKAQSVYAGLTYGKGTLNESVSDPVSNRGFLG